MGIPYYFYNLTKKYNNIIVKQIDNIDLYCIDFNGIIHPTAQKIIENKGCENDIINELWNKVIIFNNDLKPKKIIICIDGVAPFAKIIQQRKRRYLTHFKNKLDNIKLLWDTNAISPGTVFMNNLNNHLKNKIRYNVLDVEFILSGSDEYGEGEHKIFDKLLLEDTNNDKKIMINGLDADLIILSLLSNKNIVLMRENKDETIYLNINNLRIAILKELKFKWSLADDLNDIDIIESYCVMCSLLGNDFIPHLLTLNLKDNGLDRLIKITGNSIKNNGLLVSNNNINKDCLADILYNISLTEYNDLQLELNNYNSKYYKKSSSSNTNSDNYGLKNKDEIINKLLNNENWKYIYYKEIFNININLDNKYINNICHNYIKGIYWTYNYYKKINIDYEWYYPYNYPPSITDISNYIKVNDVGCGGGGRGGCDGMVDVRGREEGNEGGRVSDYLQLLLILPLDSIDLIDDKYKKYMIDIKYGLTYLYPKKYKIQTLLKNHLWECCPILPVINLKRIKNIIKQV